MISDVLSDARNEIEKCLTYMPDVYVDLEASICLLVDCMDKMIAVPDRHPGAVQ